MSFGRQYLQPLPTSCTHLQQSISVAERRNWRLNSTQNGSGGELLDIRGVNFPTMCPEVFYQKTEIGEYIKYFLIKKFKRLLVSYFVNKHSSRYSK